MSLIDEILHRVACFLMLAMTHVLLKKEDEHLLHKMQSILDKKAEDDKDYWWRLNSEEKKTLKSQSYQTSISEEQAKAFIRILENPSLGWAYIAEFNHNRKHFGKNDIVPAFGFSHQVLLQCELAGVNELKKRFHIRDNEKES